MLLSITIPGRNIVWMSTKVAVDITVWRKRYVLDYYVCFVIKIYYIVYSCLKMSWRPSMD